MGQSNGLGLGSYFNKSNKDLLSNVILQNSVFVAKNGNDTTGTRNDLTKPFLTIKEAVNIAVSGDTIYVYAGVYNEIDLLKDGINYFFYDGAIVETDQPNVKIFTDNGNKAVCTITGDIFRLISGADSDTVIFHTSHIDSKLIINANQLLNENTVNFLGCIILNDNGEFIVNVATYKTYSCNYGGGKNTIIVNLIIGGGFDCYGTSETYIIFNEWIGILGLIVGHGAQLGENAKIHIIGNYINAIYNPVNTSIGFIQFQENVNCTLKINLMEGNTNAPLLASNLEGNIKVTIEGVFENTNAGSDAYIGWFGQTNIVSLPNNFTFRNFQGRVNTALSHSIFGSNNTDVKYLNAACNKNDSPTIKSKIGGSNLIVDIDV
jgi:hypothetical protein